jgi:hypothetical protein
MHWTLATDTEIHSYANSINTSDGGTHELAVRGGLTKAVRAYAERKNLVPKNIKAIAPEDVYEGLYGIVSVLVRNPQFQGQTKEKLNNPEISSPIEASVKNACEAYLLANPTMSDAVVKRVLLAAEARLASRAAKENVTRKLSSLKLNLPGKACGLFIEQGGRHGGLHRGRRLGGRLRQDGPGPQNTGRALAPGKDPERGAGGFPREDPNKQRDQEPPGHARLRCGRALRPQQAPL